MSIRQPTRAAWPLFLLAMALAGAGAAASVPARGAPLARQLTLPRPGSTGRTPGRLAAVQERAAAAWCRLPLRFEANRGQTDARVQFLARGPGYTLFLAGPDAIVRLPVARTPSDYSIRLRLAGARPAAAEALQPLRAVSHYLLGQDPEQWHTSVPNYARVRYRDVYPGVDLEYYGNQGRLEYDFRLAPGAAPGRIRLAFDGATRIRVDRNGGLLLTTPAGTLRQLKPVAYQLADGKKRPVAARYRLLRAREGSEVAFRIGDYDRRLPLVIDPVLTYSVYLGGTGVDVANGIGVDGAGNAYVAGETASVNFPVKPGAFQTTLRGASDAFVARIDPFALGAASLVYCTYLGGGGLDLATAIAVTGAGDAYVVGQTASTDFPVTTSAFQDRFAGQRDAFLTRLNASGAPPVYSTYLGGIALDRAAGVALAGAGRVFITGQTLSSDFPVQSTAFANGSRGSGDAFVTALNTAASGSGSLFYSTYLGGAGADSGTAVAVDGAGTAFVTGQTFSADFPLTANAFQAANLGSGDAFVARLDPAAATATAKLAYGSFLGGGAADVGRAIALDPAADRALVTGQTLSADFPTTPGVFQHDYAGGGDAFVTSFDPLAASSLVYSTYLGAGGEEAGAGIAIDSFGNPTVAGFTRSPAFPSFNPVQATFGGVRDAFVTQLDSSGSLLAQSTFLGGGGDDFAQGIGLDDSDAVYVAGGTASTNFPVAGGAFQTVHRGSGDAFVARIQPGQSLQFSGSSYVVSEGAGSVTVTVTRSGGSSGSVSVRYATSNGTAAAGSDYTAASGTLAFAAGQTSKTFAVPITQDSRVEGSETFNVTLSNPTGVAALGVPSSAVVTITDDDGPGTLQFSAASYEVGEEDGTATIMVTRTEGSNGSVSVRFATSNGTAGGSDYTTVSGTLTFVNGETSKSFLVPIRQDAVVEADETVNLTLSNPTGGATLGSPNAATLTIVDDDRAGTLQFSASNYSLAEGDGQATITVSRVDGSNGSVSVRFATSDGTATAGSDYTSASGTLTFANGETSKSFVVPVRQDTVAEADETVNLALTSPTGGAVLGAPSTAVLTIVDDDRAGTLQFSAATYSAAEVDRTATITVTRSAGSNGSVTVRYATSDGTATVGSDYTAANGTLTFGSGETTRSFTVTIRQDSVVEPDETVNLTLSNPTGNATLGTPSTAVLTILDNNTPGTLQFTAATFSVGEGGGAAAITVFRRLGTAGTVSVQYATSNGSATAGQDYTTAAGTLVFGDGETSKSFAVPISQDTLAEVDETVNLTLSSPQGGATLGSPNVATLTIVDDDGAGTLQFSAAAYSVNEGNATATITVTRTDGSNGSVTVRYATSDGTASSGSDYTATSGTLAFGRGETSKSFTVRIRQDTRGEADETVNLTLRNPTGGATLGTPSTAVLTIRDDDRAGTLQFSADTYSVTERNGAVAITVTRSGGSSGTVAVRYATSNGSASSGSDYTPASGTLVFGSGQTSKTFSVAIREDRRAEGDETVNLTLRNPSGGATLGTPRSAVLTIRDDD